MAAAFGAIGTKSAGGTTSLSVAHPSGIGAGDLLLLCRAAWLNTATFTTPSGYTTGPDGTGGVNSASGDHTGRAHADYKVALGSESGSQATVQAGTISGAVGQLLRYTKNLDENWSVTVVSGVSTDASHGANRAGSQTTGTMTDAQAGDIIVAVVESDTNTSLTITSPFFTIGSSGSLAMTRRTSGAGVATGLTGNVEVFDRTLTAGDITAIGAGGSLAFAFTSATSTCGPAVFIRLRAVPGTPPVPAAHSSSPAVVKAISTGNLTTASFTPPANSTVVVGLTADSASGNTSAPTCTNSLGLPVTLQAARYPGSPAGADTGKAALWTIPVGASPAAMTVTAGNGESTSLAKMLVVKVYAGTAVDAADPIGALTSGSIGSGTTMDSGTLTPETTGGGLRMMWLDWNATGVPATLQADTAYVDAYHNAGLSTNVQLAKTVATVAGVGQTIGATLLGASTDGNWIAYELRAPSSGSSVTLVPASLALTAQPVTPTPGQVTVNLVPAAVTVAAQPVTPTPQPVTVALQPAIVQLTAQPVVATPAVQLQPATLQLQALPVVPTPGQVQLALAPASLQLTARPLTPTPGVVQIALQPAGVQLQAQPVTPTPQPVTVTLVPAQLQLAAQPVTPQASGYVTLQPAQLTLEARPVTPVPQPVQLALVPAQLALAARPVLPAPIVQLQPAQLTLAARPVTPTPGAVTVQLAPAQLGLAAQPVQPVVAGTLALQPASLQLVAQPVQPVPQPVTVQLVPAVLQLTARPVSLTLGQVQLQLQAATVQLTARPVVPQPGVVTVQLQAAQMALTAVAVAVIVGELEPLQVLAVARGKRWQAVGVASRPGTGTAGRYSAVGRGNRGVVGKHGTA